MTHADRQVVAGVDTHKDFHVAAVLDTAGRLLGVATFPANDAGYEALHGWVEEHGELFGVGVEGCGSYGAGLARDLRGRGVKVVEVCRPNRQLRRRRGKSDEVDAEAAARAVLGGVDLVTPKTADGPVEVLRALRLARRSAIKARDQAANQLHALVVTAPVDLRERLAGSPIAKLVKTLCAEALPASQAQAG